MAERAGVTPAARGRTRGTTSGQESQAAMASTAFTGSAGQTVLDVKGLSKSYGSVSALQDVNFHVSSGEVVAILGPSGCGKTTLLRVIAGLETPSAGQISLMGADVTHARVQDRRVGIMFQSYALFPHLTVDKNVKFGLEATKLPQDEQVNRFKTAMQLVRLDPREYADRLPRELSGGQQQRVALARALVIEPRILLLDEPFSNLDAKVREGMRLELLSRLKEAGVTTLLVTHDQMDAAYMSDRVVVLEHGHITQVAPYADLYTQPSSPFVGDFIGESNWIKGCRVQDVVVDSGLAVVEVPGVGLWRARLTTGGGSPSGSSVVGRACSLMIRREAIVNLARQHDTATSPTKLGDAAPAGNLFTGRVRSVVNLGLNAVVWLNVTPDGDALPFNMRHTAIDIGTGDGSGIAVAGTLDPAMCVVFDADGQ